MEGPSWDVCLPDTRCEYLPLSDFSTDELLEGTEIWCRMLLELALKKTSVFPLSSPDVPAVLLDPPLSPLARIVAEQPEDVV